MDGHPELDSGSKIVRVSRATARDELGLRTIYVNKQILLRA